MKFPVKGTTGRLKFKLALATLLLASTSSIVLCSNTTEKLRKINQVSVSDFGAIPDDGKNDEEQLRKAIDYCRLNPGTKLFWAPGVYNFRDEEAVQLMKDCMSGKFGANPQDHIFTYNFKYIIGLNFNGVHNLTIHPCCPRIFVCQCRKGAIRWWPAHMRCPNLHKHHSNYLN